MPCGVMSTDGARWDQNVSVHHFEPIYDPCKVFSYRSSSHKWRNVSVLIFLQICNEALHALHGEEAERPHEAQDHHDEQLPLQQQGAAVEERHRCEDRLTAEEMVRPRPHGHCADLSKVFLCVLDPIVCLGNNFIHGLRSQLKSQCIPPFWSKTMRSIC